MTQTKFNVPSNHALADVNPDDVIDVIEKIVKIVKDILKSKTTLK